MIRLISDDGKVASASSKKKHAQFKTLENKDQTILMTKVAQIDTLFVTKTAQQSYPLRAAHAYVAHERDPEIHTKETPRC